ncbi:uncharacterized protein LOC117647819 [Thrips palmi]|uniref:Uncharacterized protein LOC117647819 n=1 Tax=Thrips palmi TaxID=161013 RepID=A0A6P8YZS5_THRPL|nr:uncharacterized protein LOC117647819 [Thrips palmi]
MSNWGLWLVVGHRCGNPTIEILQDTLRRDAVNPATNRRFFDPTLLERGFLWPQKNVITMTPVSNQVADAERVLRLREMFKDDVLEHDFFNAPQTQLESVYEATGVEGVLDSFFRMARSKQQKLLYAVNIDLEGELKTTPQLSMRDMRSFMSHLPGEPCAGITHPAAFIGQEGTSFNPHIEDCAFQAVNRHIAGAPKMCFMIPPRFFSAFVLLLPKLGVVTNDKFCTSLLNHNYIFLDPRTVVEYGIPVFTVVQKPGDVLYLLPHTIHWGINLGLNLNESVNIASASWAKSGMIAPRRCPCLM